MARSQLERFSDEKLVLLCRTLRDTESYGELVRRHQNRLSAFLRRLCQSEAEVDDVSQVTFVKGFQKIHQYRGEASFRTWLFRIAYREFLKVERKRRSEGRLSATLPRDTIVHPIESLDAVLQQISPAQRAALLLCDAYEFTHGEAAEALGIPLGTLKSHVKRGRERLRALLETGASDE
ncbi:MAG: RNA polymerase sigma factor [Myxococcota bacterium]